MAVGNGKHLREGRPAWQVNSFKYTGDNNKDAANDINGCYAFYNRHILSQVKLKFVYERLMSFCSILPFNKCEHLFFRVFIFLISTFDLFIYYF